MLNLVACSLTLMSTVTSGAAASSRSGRSAVSPMSVANSLLAQQTCNQSAQADCFLPSCYSY